MRLKLCILGLAVVFADTCRSQTTPPPSENLMLDAIVERIGRNPGIGSGRLAVYQFAKYRIVEICAGEYGRPEIVVDHLILTTEELKELKVGDRVRLPVRRSKTILTRNNEEGFREATDEVSEFYIGERPMLLPANCKPCKPCE